MSQSDDLSFRRAGLSPAKQALLEKRLRGNLADRSPSAVIPPRGTEGPAPLSFVQERMWLAEQLMPGAPGAIIPAAMRLSGALDSSILERALGEIVRRHEILRTTFTTIHERPMQIVGPVLPPAMSVVDLSGLAAAEQEAEIHRLAAAEMERPFPLDRGPLWRVVLLRLDQQDHVLLTMMHHIIADGWSIGVLIREIGLLYAALVAQQPFPLPPLPIQYADYAVWQRRWVQEGGLTSQLAYWEKQLQGPFPVLNLPADRPQPATPTFRAATHRFVLPAHLYAALQALSRQEKATLFMTLLAGFKALLHRYTGQVDIVIGTPVAKRMPVETESLLGCFMSPLIVRTDLSGDPPFRELVARVREVSLNAYAHQDVPFEAVVQTLRPQWGLGHVPLFQHMFILQNMPLAPLELPGLTIRPFLRFNTPTSALDLTLSLREVGSQLTGFLQYRTDLFEESTILHLLEDYQRLLEEVVQDPESRLSAISIRPARKEQAAPKAGLAQRAAGLSPAKQALLELMLQEAQEGEPPQQIMPAASSTDPPPLSFGQQRLWFLDQLEPGNVSLNAAGTFLLEGVVHVPVLERALNTIIQRHSVLRSSYRNADGRPLQVIAPSLNLSLPIEDLSHLPEAEREAAAQAILAEEVRQPFDLAHGPLVRARLLRLEERRHLLGLTMHHIVCDGWSVEVLFRELTTLYQAFVAGHPSPLPDLPVQYADYARWQRSWMRGERMEAQLAYWKKRLGGHLPILELPTDRPRPGPASFTYRGASYAFRFPSSLHEDLQNLSRRAGVTLFMTLLAAYKVLLHRYTGQGDILVDSPVAGRNRPEVENLIGFFVNTLVLRTNLSGNPSFATVLNRVRETCLEAYAHQDVPFERVVAALQPERHLNRTPLAQVSLMLHKKFVESVSLAEGLKASLVDARLGTDELDLMLFLWEGADGLTGTVEYNAELWDAATIERLIGHFRTLLEGIVADPEQRLGDLPLLTGAEREQVLVTWNRTATAWGRQGCVHRLFERQAAQCPERIAMIAGNRKWAYHELNRRANQVAHRLRALGVGPDTPVGLWMDRAPEMIIGMLGILKAGAAYLPLDPTYPRERLAFMLQDAGPSVLITRPPVLESSGLRLEDVAARSTVLQLDVDNWQPAPEPGWDVNPVVDVSPLNTAYIIYTSGSTGRPKGVLVPHGAVVNHNLAVIQQFKLASTDRVLQFHSINFDAAVEEIFPTLISGATLVLQPNEALLSVRELMHWVEQNQITVLNLPTAYWHLWVDEMAQTGMEVPAGLRLVIVGGEKVSAEHFAIWRAKAGAHVRWLNTYGPTEATVIATAYEPLDAGATNWPAIPDAMDGFGHREVPIGRPIANIRLYVLDGYGQPVPIGVPGELHIGGAGVTRGYLGQPGLTAARFVPDPFGAEPGERLYRTGDRVRYLPDGNIEFLGRVDGQLKVRGYRIEPGEVEVALGEHPAVQQAVVVARALKAAAPASTAQQLVAYLVLRHDVEEVPTATDFRTFVAGKLPSYMVPAAFVVLDRWPLTPAGKVDRAALPAPDEAGLEGAASYVAPRTATEKVIAEIYAQVLGVGPVGALDHFFERGGHSLQATQVVSRLRQALGVEIPLRILFQAPTVEKLAASVETIRWTMEGRPEAASSATEEREEGEI